jgi:subtilisin family serine protease
VGGEVYGIAKGVNLYDVQVLGDDGTGDMFTIVDALYDVANQLQKTSVGVMSLGGSPSSTLKVAAQFAREQGLIISASSGNYDDDACKYSPGDSPDVITVSAYDTKGDKAYFSNYGSCVEVYAPGVQIRSAYKGSPTATATLSGTSMAAPIIGGIVATLINQNPYLDFELAVEVITTQVKTGFMQDGLLFVWLFFFVFFFVFCFQYFFFKAFPFFLSFFFSSFLPFSSSS